MKHVLFCIRTHFALRYVSLANQHYGYVIKEDEMGEACGTCDRKGK